VCNDSTDLLPHCFRQANDELQAVAESTGSNTSLIDSHASKYWVAYLVRTVPNDSIARLFSYGILATAIIALFSYYLVSKKPLIKGTVFERNFGDHGKRNAEHLLRVFCALATIGGLWMIIGITPSLMIYKTNPSSANVEVHTISHIDSAAVPGAFYIHMVISTDDGKHLSYWYPSLVLRTGSKYTFTLLPNSDFVLRVEPAK
jgi:hypothetical protein